MPNRVHLALIRAAIRWTGPFTGLRLAHDHEARDVFVVGFPKSGHTWVQYLFAGLAGLDTAQCADALVQELVPDLQSHLAYRRYMEPVVFKSHLLPRADYRRVIYLLRDGRDAMVSYFHHHNAIFPAVDFPTLIRRAPHLDARWHEHVEAWLANPHGAELLVVRYEELKRDPIAGLRRMADFAGLAATDDQIARAVAGAAFEKQKKREAEKGWEDKNWPKAHPFVRRGAVGSHRDEMPAEALALFEAEAGPTLRKLGYAT
ncbi:MAG: hypothetical protein RLZZ15_4293 [Verrucomicrobiota bacterium]|jgi:hypothetical protein